MRILLPKLAASPVVPLRGPFKNNLLNPNVSWAQDVNYLRDAYNEIREAWENESSDEEIYNFTKLKLQELIAGLKEAVSHIPRKTGISKELDYIDREARIAETAGNTGDFSMGTIYQSYTLIKIHQVLSHLTYFASKPKPFDQLAKKAYGWDVSGEVQESTQKNIEDTAQPTNQHGSPHNPSNAMIDVDAIEDFPDLADKTKPNFYPRRYD
jgi:hypothetical protein